MKKLKITLLAMLSIVLVNNTYAQDLREGFHFGLKAGTNMSNIWDREAQNFTSDPLIGFAGGGFVAIPLGKFLAIQPEIMFSQKGFRGSGKVLGIDYEMQRRTNFLEFPILLAVRPFPFLSIVAGPQFSFLLSQKDDITVGGVSASETEKFENDNWRKNQLGMHLGLDINVKHFVISPRAAIDFLDNNGDGTSSDPNYKNFYVQLTIGYKF